MHESVIGGGQGMDAVCGAQCGNADLVKASKSKVANDPSREVMM